MTATDKPSVIDALIKKQEDEYVDWTARAFHELASVARLRKIVLRDLKAEIEQALEAQKQAYAEQAIKTALEKVKTELKKKMVELGGENCNFLRDARMFEVIDNLLSESSKGEENQR